jgi:hypothetical protein
MHAVLGSTSSTANNTWRLKQEDLEFEVSLGCLKTPKRKKVLFRRAWDRESKVVRSVIDGPQPDILLELL